MSSVDGAGRGLALTGLVLHCLIAPQGEATMCSRPSTRLLALVLGAFLPLLAASAAQAQLQLSVVSGRVLGPDGAPMRNVQVALRDPLGEAIATVISDEAGRFRLRSVAPGVYHLGAEAPALRSPMHRITVSDGLPIDVDLR